MCLDDSLLDIILAMFFNIPTHFKILALEVRLKCCYENCKDSAKKPHKDSVKTLQRNPRDYA